MLSCRHSYRVWVVGVTDIFSQLVLIFAGAAALATLFLYLRQPIILAYIALGVLVGPSGLGLITDADEIEKLSHFGIILLLFLIGLNFQPAKLIGLLGEVSLITLATCLIFTLALMLVAWALGFAWVDALVIGAALMFSSTIVSLKLIPTTELHHHHVGKVMIGVLLMQDIIAILLLLLVTSGVDGDIMMTMVGLILKLLALSAAMFIAVKFVLMKLFIKFDVIKEHTFLMALGWGLFGAGMAQVAGLSYEMGAFIAGVSLATVPIALIIAEDLKPLRDFFLIMFFFAIGAKFDLVATQQLLLPGVVIAALIIVLKPLVFNWGFKLAGETPEHARELGVRLGQGSEFSLLVAFSALSSGVISQHSSHLIQLVVVLTFVVSTYWVVNRYPTPISYKSGQRRD